MRVSITVSHEIRVVSSCRNNLTTASSRAASSELSERALFRLSRISTTLMGACPGTRRRSPRPGARLSSGATFWASRSCACAPAKSSSCATNILARRQRVPGEFGWCSSSQAHWSSASCRSLLAAARTSEVTLPKSKMGAALQANTHPMEARAAAASEATAAAFAPVSWAAQATTLRSRTSPAASAPRSKSSSARYRSCTSAATPSHRASSGPAKGGTTLSNSALTVQCRRSCSLPSLLLNLFIIMLSCAEALAVASPPGSSFGRGGSRFIRSSPTPPCRRDRHTMASGSQQFSLRT
mmetsp:Transcript_87723/g.281655  ORF Transcript_87723/g.281655 Transcript_87723/m.281655 type:complete len:297 (+) Transcript_87723:163-1053(+)